MQTKVCAHGSAQEQYDAADARLGRRRHPDARAHRGGRGRVPRVLDERHREPRAPGRPRRAEAVAAPDPLGDARRQPPARPPVREVRARRRRRDGELPPARRHRDLRRARPHGPVVLAHRPADRQARQLRLARRPAGRLPVHGVPAVAARDGDARRDRRGHGRLRAELRRVGQRADGRARAVPEPARERRAGDRGRDGDQHPAAQPRRRCATPRSSSSTARTRRSRS